MAGSHGLHELERFAAPDLTDDDPVWAQPKSRPKESSHADLASAHRIRRLRFEVHHVAQVDLELFRVFENDDSIVVSRKGNQGVE
jgi:hypothetical protein